MPEPRPIIDPRIADAMQEIGTIVEHDELNAADYEAIATALDLMAQITRGIADARAQRRGGNITLAVRIENRVERLIGAMPEGSLWS